MRYCAFFLLMMLSSICFGSQDKEGQDEILVQQFESLRRVTDEDKEFDLAIEDRGSKTAYYRVPVPKNFVIGGIKPGNDFSIELVPNGDMVEDWSEILTFAYTAGHQSNIHIVLKFIKDQFESDSPSELIDLSKMSFTKDQGIQIASYLYDGPHAMPRQDISKTHNEAVAVNMIKSDEGIWSAQYAIKYPKNLPAEEKEAIIKKIQGFKGKVIIR